MNGDAPEVFSCPNCERLYDANGAVLSPRLCVPVSKACGQNDCEEVRKEKADMAQVIRQSRQEVLTQREAQRKHCSSPNADKMHQRRARALGGECHRGMPPEREDCERDGSTLNQAEQQTRYANGDHAKSENERMLAELLRTFDLNDPTRTARSRWVSNKEWWDDFRIERPNSRASQLNGSRTIEPHPIIKMHRLRVDQRTRPGNGNVIERSLCYIEHSLFLARERRKEDDHQISLQRT